jgi:hypothetical protein
VRRAFGVDEDEGEVGVVERAGDGEMDDLELHGFAEDGLQAEDPQSGSVATTPTRSARFGEFHPSTKPHFSAWLWAL